MADALWLGFRVGLGWGQGSRICDGWDCPCKYRSPYKCEIVLSWGHEKVFVTTGPNSRAGFTEHRFLPLKSPHLTFGPLDLKERSTLTLTLTCTLKVCHRRLILVTNQSLTKHQTELCWEQSFIFILWSSHVWQIQICEFRKSKFQEELENVPSSPSSIAGCPVCLVRFRMVQLFKVDGNYGMFA